MTAKKRNTLIVFDLVSTLTDAGPRYAAAFARVCNDNGINPPRQEDLLAMLGNKNLKQITDRFAGILDAPAKQGFMTECNRACDAMLYDVNWIERLFPNVRETLKDLKEQGYVLGIYTGTREDALEAQLRYHNIGQYFDRRYIRAKDNQRDGMVSSDELKARQLDSIHAEWRRNGGERVIVVGDSAADVTAASRAGLSFVGFAENAWKADKLKQAGSEKIFNNFRQIDSILKEVSQKRVAPSSGGFRGMKRVGGF